MPDAQRARAAQVEAYPNQLEPILEALQYMTAL